MIAAVFQRIDYMQARFQFEVNSGGGLDGISRPRDDLRMRLL
jgi:hypothetical protein